MADHEHNPSPETFGENALANARMLARARADAATERLADALTAEHEAGRLDGIADRRLFAACVHLLESRAAGGASDDLLAGMHRLALHVAKGDMPDLTGAVLARVALLTDEAIEALSWSVRPTGYRSPDDGGPSPGVWSSLVAAGFGDATRLPRRVPTPIGRLVGEVLNVAVKEVRPLEAHAVPQPNELAAPPTYRGRPVTPAPVPGV